MEERSRIRVCVRLRPLIQEDFKLAAAKLTVTHPDICVQLLLDGQTIRMQRAFDAKTFRLDHTFDSASSQQEVYNASFRPIVQEALGGFSGTGLAYGQTGSGKSHTMFGSPPSPADSGEAGLVQLAIEDVFAAAGERVKRGLVANVFVSFYQLYLEQAYDLLAMAQQTPIQKHTASNGAGAMGAGAWAGVSRTGPGNGSTSGPGPLLGSASASGAGPVSGSVPGLVPLGIRDSARGSHVQHLQYLLVEDATTACAMVRRGLESRRVQATSFNVKSSRSHAIFQLYLDFEVEPGEVEPTCNGANGGGGGSVGGSVGSKGGGPVSVSSLGDSCNIRRRVLTFVDLAGSERATHPRSKRQFQEAVGINKSISALGNCIQALANNAQATAGVGAGVGEGAGSDVGLETGVGAGASIGVGIHARHSLSRLPPAPTPTHVPFRDCKLTRLLAEPLGGNAKVCVVVNVGPCAYNYEETRCTLKFARRAMRVCKSVGLSAVEQVRVRVREVECKRVLGGKGAVTMSREVVREVEEEEEDGVGEQEQEQGREQNAHTPGNGLHPHPQTHAHSHKRQYVVELPGGGAGAGTGAGLGEGGVRLSLGDFLKACQAQAGVGIETGTGGGSEGLGASESISGGGPIGVSGGLGVSGAVCGSGGLGGGGLSSSARDLFAPTAGDGGSISMGGGGGISMGYIAEMGGGDASFSYFDSSFLVPGTETGGMGMGGDMGVSGFHLPGGHGSAFNDLPDMGLTPIKPFHTPLGSRPSTAQIHMQVQAQMELDDAPASTRISSSSRGKFVWERGSMAGASEQATPPVDKRAQGTGQGMGQGQALAQEQMQAQAGGRQRVTRYMRYHLSLPSHTTHTSTSFGSPASAPASAYSPSLPEPRHVGTGAGAGAGSGALPLSPALTFSASVLRALSPAHSQPPPLLTQVKVQAQEQTQAQMRAQAQAQQQQAHIQAQLARGVGPYSFFKSLPPSAPAPASASTPSSAPAPSTASVPVYASAPAYAYAGNGATSAAAAVPAAKALIPLLPTPVPLPTPSEQGQGQGGGQGEGQLISLVLQLKEELQKKDDEISSLRSFILNN